MRTFLAALAGALCAMSAQAQAPYLVTDLNTSTPTAESSLPHSFTAFGPSVYFTATTATTGAELFKTDGATVQFVKDIAPGSAGSNPYTFLDLGNGTFLFSATNDTYGRELWRTDGTEAGTVIVKDIVLGTTGSEAAPRVAVGGKAFLTTGTTHDLWVTDGTAAGTRQLRSAVTPMYQQFYYATFGGLFYFASGGALWRSDGTESGTYVVKDDVWPRQIIATSNRLFFVGGYSEGVELWTSDGTESGTMIVKDIYPGPWDSIVSAANDPLAAIGTSVVFFANDGTSASLQLWRSDGTEAGTQIIREVALSLFTNRPPLRSAAGYVFFTVQGTLWRTDATNAGTIQLNNTPGFNAGAFASTPDALYFRARTVGIYRLWKSDGTPGGTVEIEPDVRLESDPQLSYANGKLYFAGSSAVTGIEPWTSNGTTAGTALLANLMADPGASSKPESLRASGDKVFFTANDGSTPPQLWRSDGTPSGTVELTQFPDSAPVRITVWNGLAFFVHANHLWRSDGTLEGTVLLKEMSNIESFFAASNLLYFVGFKSPDFVDRLWRTDGTETGTIQLGNVDSWYVPGEMGGRVYFVANGALRRTAGTIETTQQISSNHVVDSGLAVLGGALYYVSGAGTNDELWKSDGTFEGSALLKEVRPGSEGSKLRSFTPAGSLLYFIADDGTHGDELWRTDGTEAGTFLLRDILPGEQSSAPGGLTAVDGTLYFTADNGVDGSELWKSDGTVAGTVLVTDLAPGTASSVPQGLMAAADGEVWFGASTPGLGVELWRSNGTEPGTTMVADLVPGNGSSSPLEITAAGRSLFFSASTSFGRELWAMPLASTSFSIRDAHTVEQDSGTQQLRFTVTRSGDVAHAATIAYATSNGSATAGTDFIAQAGSLPFAAGVTTAFIDVPIQGDNVLEQNEAFFVTLSAPSSGAIERAIGTGTIENEDQVSALSVGFVHLGYYNRTVIVTNAGPSTATAVQLRFIESPNSFLVSSSCVNSGGGKLCALGTLLPGESRTVQFAQRIHYQYSYLYDPANPPGVTSTVMVSAAEFDPDLSDNTAARMFSHDGYLMTPSFLVAGTTAAAEFLFDRAAESPTPVTLSSSNPLVVVSPSTITIPVHERGATFALQTGNGTGTTKLETASTSAFTIPVVLPGNMPKLDTLIEGPFSTFNHYYGQDIEVRARVVGQTVAGSLPTGRIQLLDESDNLLEEMTLDASATATFIRSGLVPGTYRYRVRYLGDANFNPVTVTYPSYPMLGWRTTTSVVIPRVICGHQFEVAVTVSTQDSTTAPTGGVLIYLNGEPRLTLQLAPSQEAGQSKASVQLPVSPGFVRVDAEYQPTGAFIESDDLDSVQWAGNCAPVSLSATATSTTSVALTWTSTGALQYEIHRADQSGFSHIESVATISYVDTQVQADRTYIYRVRPVGGQYSEPDIATTYFFVNDPIVPGVTRIQAGHLLQLRTAANFARTAARLSPSQAIGTPPATAGAIRAFHIKELREAIDEARKFIGLPPMTYTDPTLPAGMLVKAAHVQELRNALK